MNTKEMEYMLTLDQCRSITQAAEKLHMTQPALSIFLSKLESSLDMTLFERVGKKLIPTQAGNTYIKYARQILRIKSDFELEAMELKKELRGALHVGCLEKRSHYLMPKLMRKLKELHPGIDIILYNNHPEELYHTLLDGTIDLLYVNRDLHMPELNSRLVCSDRLILVLPAEHPAIRYAVPIKGERFPYLSLKYFENETFYIPRQGYSIRFLIDDAIQYSQLHPHSICSMATIDLGCQMAAEGLGISFSTEAYIRNLFYPAPCKFFLTGDLSNKVTWMILWRKSTILTQYMEDFMELLEELEQNARQLSHTSISRCLPE